MEQQQIPNRSSTAWASPTIPTGAGIFPNPPHEKHLVSTKWLEEYGLDATKLIRVMVNGRSMEPLIPHGAWVTVDTGNTEVEDGSIYLFRVGDRVALACLFKEADGGFVVRSYDPAEPDSMVTRADLEDFAVVGRVIECTTMWVKPVDEQAEVSHG